MASHSEAFEGYISKWINCTLYAFIVKKHHTKLPGKFLIRTHLYKEREILQGVCINLNNNGKEKYL